MKKKVGIWIVALYVLCIHFPFIAHGQAPDLGRVSGFSVFTAIGAITNTGATHLNGNTGTNAGAFAGFPPGILKGNIHVADYVTTLASTDAGVAYTYLNTMTCGTVLGTSLGYNQVLSSGIYCLGAASTLNGTLTLDGQGNPDALFVFKIDGALTAGISSKVILINGASLINVYWQVNGQFDLGDSSVFKGTLIANGAINLLDKSSFYGRAISISGAISMYDNVIAAPADVYFKTTGYYVTDTSNWSYNRLGSAGNDFAGNMNDDSINWHLLNVSAAVENSPWLMGDNSRILLGDSINAISFTINNGSDLSGLIDTINSHATLVVKSDSIPYLNIAKNNSTVHYGKMGNQFVRPVTYSNLIVSDSGIKTLTGTTVINNELTIVSGTLATAANNLTLGASASAQIDSMGILSISNSAAVVDFNNRPVTLKSTLAGSAIISEIKGSLINATAVTVERYLEDKRAWRLLTTPLYSLAGNIYSNWQESGSVAGTYGTLITCPSAYANTTTGMDTAPNNNYGFVYWGGSAWIGVRDAKTVNSLMNNNSSSGANAFFLFSRGDRTISAINGGSGHSATTLRATGILITGNVVYNSFGYSKGWSSSSYTPTNGTYVLIANPYASPVSLDQLYSASTNINRTFWTWDPTIATTGAYVTINWNGMGYTIAGGATAQNEYLQSGQGVFVQANAASPSIVFTEASKTTNQITGVFGNNNAMSQLSVDLRLVNDSLNNVTHSEDGMVLLFNNNFSIAASDAADAVKFNNIEESISWVAGKNNLSIDALPFPASGDTIFLNINGLKMDTDYNVLFTPLNINTSGLNAVLYDSYKQLKIPVSLSNVSTINFRVLSSEIKSYAFNRFALIFAKVNDSALPVKFISVKGTLLQNKIEVSWSVADQVNVLNYIIEKSLDGVSFKQVSGIITNSFNTNYSWIDNDINIQNYYRIRVISYDRSDLYSKVVVVNDKSSGNDFIVVSPNPANGSVINVQLNGDKGDCWFNIINVLGEVVLSKKIYYSGGKQSIDLKADNIISTGIYNLQCTNKLKTYNIQLEINNGK